MCAPSGVTEVEKRAVEEASLAAGARRVHLIEEPIAAAIGAGVAIEEPVGRMVVDVGGGTSEMAVISLGGIVVSRSVRVGGYEMDEAIAHYLRSVHQLAIGSRTAEAIKIEIGSVMPLQPEETIEVRGRHLVTGLPTAVELRSEEVRAAITAPAARDPAARSATRSRRPRPSWPPTSPATASCSPAAARWSVASRSSSPRRPGCRCTRPSRRSPASAFGSGQALDHFDQLSRASRHRVPSLTAGLAHGS